MWAAGWGGFRKEEMRWLSQRRRIAYRHGNEALLETFGYFLRPTNTLFDVYLQQG